MTYALFFAQQSPTTPQSGTSGLVMMTGLAIAMVVFFLISSRSQSRERNKRQAMLDAMKKNDRVLTIGGIIGTVVQVRDTEVVLKVDESTNTKMTFAKRAIQQVLAEDVERAAETKPS